MYSTNKNFKKLAMAYYIATLLCPVLGAVIPFGRFMGASSIVYSFIFGIAIPDALGRYGLLVFCVGYFVLIPAVIILLIISLVSIQKSNNYKCFFIVVGIDSVILIGWWIYQICIMGFGEVYNQLLFEIVLHIAYFVCMRCVFKHIMDTNDRDSSKMSS